MHCRNSIALYKNAKKKKSNVFTFHLVGKRVTLFLKAEDNQFVFNAKQNLISAANTHNYMTKHVFGPENVYSVPQCVFMEQKN